MVSLKGGFNGTNQGHLSFILYLYRSFLIENIRVSCYNSACWRWWYIGIRSDRHTTFLWLGTLPLWGGLSFDVHIPTYFWCLDSKLPPTGIIITFRLLVTGLWSFHWKNMHTMKRGARSYMRTCDWFQIQLQISNYESYRTTQMRGHSMIATYSDISEVYFWY